MDSILMQLYKGEINPVEQFAPKFEDYKKKREEQYSHYVEFMDKLEPPLEKEFIKIMDEQLDTIPFEMSEMYIAGFRTGIRIIIESLSAETNSKNLNLMLESIMRSHHNKEHGEEKNRKNIPD